MDLADRIGLDRPVVQAGMGGGVAGGELAGAVSAAGALGTVGIMAPPAFGAALRRARDIAGHRPVAANLLVPFTRRAHVDACVDQHAALVVFHGGIGARWFGPVRVAGIPVFVTVGTAEQALAALAAGADGVVVQGVEAGGHLVGTGPLASALPAIRSAVGDGVPILAAGGVADAEDVRAVLAGGATAAVAGTRFLLTEESRAHPDYQQRVLAADRTLTTMLFGFGWPLLHRVIPNAATDRWCAESGASRVDAVTRFTAPLGRALPLSAMGRLLQAQRARLPIFSPGVPLAGMPADVVETSALYAGETLHRLHDILPAAEAVERLTPS